MKKKYTYAVIVILMFFVLYFFRRKYRISRTAKRFKNEKEIGNNSGFENKKLESLMKKTGWKSGEPWCMAFVKSVVWKSVKNPTKRKVIDKTLNSGTQSSFANMLNDTTGTFKQITKPKRGDIVIWERMTGCAGTGKGHAGIVLSATKTGIKTIEGNTNEAGSREGTAVLKKERKLDFENCNGLRIKGFFRII